jgi:hypothetical protein
MKERCTALYLSLSLILALPYWETPGLADITTTPPLKLEVYALSKDLVTVRIPGQRKLFWLQRKLLESKIGFNADTQYIYLSLKKLNELSR